VFSGPQAIAGYAQSHFLAFPDVMLELESAFVAGDRAAAEAAAPLTWVGEVAAGSTGVDWRGASGAGGWRGFEH